MSLDLYSTWALAGVITTLKPTVPGFWLSWFGRTFNFDTEEVHFDVVTPDRKIAPFVMPTVAGVPQRDKGFSTDKYKPGYVKVLNSLSPQRTLSRMAGEGFGGVLNPQQRAQALLGQYLVDHRDQVERRWNWMAAQAMLYGKITLSGDNYPTAVIDFGRASTHEATLASGSRWGDAGVVPLDNMEDWAGIVMTDSGYPVDQVVMGPTAWRAFRKNTDLKELLDLRAGTGKLNGLDITPGNGQPLEFKGSDGNRSYWVYNETYDTDEAGTTVQMMDPRDVLLVASGGVAGARAFGAILDIDVLRPQDIFVKSYVKENPSARFLLTQSAPMMIPGRPNATLRRRVVA